MEIIFLINDEKWFKKKCEKYFQLLADMED